MKIDDWVNKIHNGHVIDILNEIPSNSVNVVVTSPPYWGLRDYGEGNNIIWGGKEICEHEFIEDEFRQHAGRGDCQKSGKYSEQDDIPDKILKRYICSKCGAWKGQLGLEPHPQMFINHLVEIFNIVKRILRKDGILFLNIGDTYCGAKGGFYNKRKDKNYFGFTNNNCQMKRKAPKFDGKWLQRKQLLLIPSRLAILLQNEGWILRNDIIWYKPNHMPSAVKDRLTKSYEHVFMFTKNEKYYFNLNNIRIPHKSLNDLKRKKRLNNKGDGKGQRKDLGRNREEYYSVKGKNPGDVWSINTKPCKEAHFATYPTTLIERILKCSCPKDGIVMDTFIGSGTTGLVAKQLGLNFIGIELNKEYCEIASRRIGDAPIMEFKKKDKVSKAEEPKVDWKKVFDV